MISFDCPACGKPLIVRTNLAGTGMNCPSCRTELVVPPPPPRARRRGWLVLLLVAVVVAGAFGFRAVQQRRPARIQERFAERLRAFSPEWRGMEWTKCDPDQGDYHASVLFTSGQGTYTFDVAHLAGTDQAVIRVNPQAHGPKWLAYALFQLDEQQVFDYSGLDEAERDRLQELTKDVNEALRHAVR
jgi:hypothetical protein